jgi:2'-hydroxyisoflavone reductase
MRLLVIGGARFSGRALTGLALDRGHDVTVFHRGSGPDDPWPHARHVHADRSDGFGALAAERFDAVVDTCGYVPREVRASTEAFGDVDVYAYYSSLSAHVDDARIGATEDDDVHKPPFPDTEEITEFTYGPLKVACEHEVRAAMGDRALLIRPGYIVGPDDPTDRFTYWVRRAARGGEMLAAGPEDYAMQWVDARDLAAFILTLVERGASGPFSVVTPPGRHTMRELLTTARDLAGADTSFAWVDHAFADAHGLLDDASDPLPLWTPQIPGAHLFDTTKADAAGLTTRPIVDTVRDTLVWDEGRGAPWPMEAGLSDEREREVLAAWRARA